VIPIKLKLQNFLSHSQSEIDFNKFNVALVLGSYNGELDHSNGSGKSSLLEAIIWALFGKSRHKRKDGIVKKDKRNCKVEFVFEIDGVQYKISRRRDKILGEEDVIFEQLDGIIFKNISCDTNSATNDKIIDIINVNYEVFVNSVYFKQNDISMFAESTPSKRKDILKALLKMDIWDEYQKVAKDKAATLSAKIEEKSNFLVPNENIDQTIDTINKEILNLNDKLLILNLEYSDINKNILIKTSRLQLLSSNLQTGPDQLKKIQKEYNEIKKRISQIDTKLLENTQTIKTNDGLITDIHSKISILSDKIKAKKDINISDLHNKLISGKTKKTVYLVSFFSLFLFKYFLY